MASEQKELRTMGKFLTEFATACHHVYDTARRKSNDVADEHAHEAGIAAVNAYAQWVRASDPKEIATSMIHLAESREQEGQHGE